MKAAIFVVSVLLWLLVPAHSASIASNDVLTSAKNTHETLKEFKKEAARIHVRRGSSKDAIQDYRIAVLETKYTNLLHRIHRARVSCYSTATSWDLRSNAPIMYLDRQNVKCSHPYFLAGFHLVRAGDFDSAKVRFNYRCCKFIL